MERRLTTILAADVADFSRLVERDEEGTLAMQARFRADIIDPLTADHGGRVANTAGDSLLVEFPSTIEAVRFAVAVQSRLGEANADLPADRQFAYRIGINVGDVVRQGGDLLGDAVNVAARLEALAEPGGIVVSQSVRDYVRRVVDCRFEDLGRVRVKNISRPVRAYRVATGAAPAPPRRRFVRATAFAAIAAAALLGAWRYGPPLLTAGGGGWNRPAAAPSVAVLPFDNLSPDPDQIYFADGLADDLITDLSKISSARVIARSTSFDFRDRAQRVAAIHRELRVAYVVEGSVRRNGPDLRITAQVLNARDGSILWSDRFEGSGDDLFGFQDRIVASVIKAVRLELTTQEQAALDRHGTRDLAAYDAYLRGLRLLSVDGPTGQAYLAAREFRAAARHDPEFAEAYAWRAWALQDLGEAWPARPGWREDAERLARTSVSLADNAPARRSLARQSLSIGGAPPAQQDPDAALTQLRRAAQMQPGDPGVLADMAVALAFTGGPDRGRDLAAAAQALDPGHAERYAAASGLAALLAGDAQAALPDLRSWSKSAPAGAPAHAFYGAALGLLGESDAAGAALARFEEKPRSARGLVLVPEGPEDGSGPAASFSPDHDAVAASPSRRINRRVEFERDAPAGTATAEPAGLLSVNALLARFPMAGAEAELFARGLERAGLPREADRED